MTRLKMTRGSENYCCFSHSILHEHGMTVGTLTVSVELYKESLFPNLLDRTLDKFEDYKAELLDKASMVNCLPHAVHTDLGRDEDVKEDSHSASVNAHISI